eukprot:6214771-Pleurochrysis_carterae.AAC.4
MSVTGPVTGRAFIECVVCAHMRLDRDASVGATAPRAHCEKVICELESLDYRAAMSGNSRMGSCALCRYNGESADGSAWRHRNWTSEIRVGCEHHTMFRRNSNVICSRRGGTSPQVDAEPGLRLHAYFGVSRSGFHGLSAASTGENAHYTGLFKCEQFVGRGVTVRRSGSAIEDFRGVHDGVFPEGGWGIAAYH